MSTLIKNGLVVTAAEEFHADVYVEGEVVSAVGAALDVEADEVFDAAGRYVLPGMVDPHTHLETPAGGTVTCDDFTSGTIAAAFGGTTTLIHFCVPAPGENFLAALNSWHQRLERHRPVIDVGFHMFVIGLDSGGTLDELARLPDEGVTSYKVFTAYKDDLMLGDAALFEVMQLARRTGALVMAHAENGDVIDVLVRQALARGHTEPRWHGRTRPPAVEAEATNRVIELAHIADAPLYVVHVTCAGALTHVARARSRGWDVTAETCTHYRYVDATALDRPGWEAARYVYSPPPRGRDDREALWSGLASGALTVVSSDHNAFTLEQKALGRGDFSKIPNGAAGVESRLQVVYELGVRGAG